MEDFTACFVITKFLQHFGIRPKKFDFVRPTISRQKVHVGWAQDYAQ